MAITSSARRAIRVSARKKAFNDNRSKAMKETIKEVRQLVSAQKGAEAKKLLSAAYKAIDKAMKRGVIKKNTAARKKSRLSQAIKKIS
ncbi:MAG: 30S ribosomal protein S20 [Candidatus Lloydbacteria bacterium RIFCSPHIGHO2_01_FULL_41_20]|uniref:Small ribosomal subunit protein bS20 n=1 Tax=Candidatus Lloydbacteria bacterium RIFCSPHIGHO2_01_FULL_41_20 TaxID=1798657 RepID=A0A1G2CUA4_9BACT|nr:MAG: 30S ribosomal protein S20 [Candidatus Lloydbacteria bacterium RIFCSPHIGHO2_01_FULL_41_20]